MPRASYFEDAPAMKMDLGKKKFGLTAQRSRTQSIDSESEDEDIIVNTRRLTTENENLDDVLVQIQLEEEQVSLRHQLIRQKQREKEQEDRKQQELEAKQHEGQAQVEKAQSQSSTNPPSTSDDMTRRFAPADGGSSSGGTAGTGAGRYLGTDGVGQEATGRSIPGIADGKPEPTKSRGNTDRMKEVDALLNTIPSSYSSSVSSSSDPTRNQGSSFSTGMSTGLDLHRASSFKPSSITTNTSSRQPSQGSPINSFSAEQRRPVTASFAASSSAPSDRVSAESSVQPLVGPGLLVPQSTSISGPVSVDVRSCRGIVASQTTLAVGDTATTETSAPTAMRPLTGKVNGSKPRMVTEAMILAGMSTVRSLSETSAGPITVHNLTSAPFNGHNGTSSTATDCLRFDPTINSQSTRDILNGPTSFNGHDDATLEDVLMELEANRGSRRSSSAESELLSPIGQTGANGWQPEDRLATGNFSNGIGLHSEPPVRGPFPAQMASGWGDQGLAVGIVGYPGQQGFEEPHYGSRACLQPRGRPCDFTDEVSQEMNGLQIAMNPARRGAYSSVQRRVMRADTDPNSYRAYQETIIRQVVAGQAQQSENRIRAPRVPQYRQPRPVYPPPSYDGYDDEYMGRDRYNYGPDPRFHRKPRYPGYHQHPSYPYHMIDGYASPPRDHFYYDGDEYYPYDQEWECQEPTPGQHMIMAHDPHDLPRYKPRHQGRFRLGRAASPPSRYQLMLDECPSPSRGMTWDPYEVSRGRSLVRNKDALFWESQRRSKSERRHRKEMRRAEKRIRRIRYGNSGTAGYRRITLRREKFHREFGLSIIGGIDSGLGVFVCRVDPEGLAHSAGVRVGDELVIANGKDVRRLSSAETRHLIQSASALDLLIKTVGNGDNYVVQHTYCWRDAAGREVSPPPDPHITPYQRPWGSVRRVDLHLDLGEQLGVSVRGGAEVGLGVYVSSVAPRSPAEAAGIRVGDEILHVNNQRFADLTHDEAVCILKYCKSLVMVVCSLGKVPYGPNDLCREHI